MRVGGASVSTHHAGMSSLWHDPDFEPIREFDAPIVLRSYDGMPLPTEQHELPDGVEDPFKKLDAVYDVAGAQMERGIKGAAFLHGKPPPSAVVDKAMLAGPDDVTRVRERPTDPARAQQHSQNKQFVDQARRLEQAAIQPSMKASSSTTSAGEREAQHAANSGGVDSVVGAMATVGPMVTAQVAAAGVQGPLPTIAAQAASAVQTVNAVAAAGEVALVGVDAAVDHVGDATEQTPRRGLKRS